MKKEISFSSKSEKFFELFSAKDQSIDLIQREHILQEIQEIILPSIKNNDFD